MINLKSIDKIYDTGKALLIAVVIAVVIRSFLFEPYTIPSGSMKPNFLEGDYIIVSKYYYGISRCSLPFSPKIFKGRILELHQPKRGDVIVFKSPYDHKYYIKRLIGLPGDKIQVIDGRLFINNKQTDHKMLPTFTDRDGTIFNRYLEKLPDDPIEFEILDITPYGDLDRTPVYFVPQNKYFFMGDNRDASLDSRVLSGPIGFVDKENIVGRVELILFSNKYSILKIWDWVRGFDFSRFFKVIHS